MSIAGYFCKRGNELRMPKGRDSLGIGFDGPVLTGEKSFRQALLDDALRAQDPATRIPFRLPGKF